MKIGFHGAARTVTGSKHLLTLDNGRQVLLDCGMFQGMGKETDTLNGVFGFDAQTVDYLILSHAHIDHSGLVPKLVKDGFKGKIFATSGTRDLCAVLLEDSAEIQRDDTHFENKKRAQKGLPPIEPLYGIEDARKAMDLFQVVPYGSFFQIEPGLELLYTDAGHIIGSAAVSLKITSGGRETHLTFSGDVGRYKDLILKSPQAIPQADYILIESTYGDSLHLQVADAAEVLLDWITKTCLQKKGKLIIPAFSVGRTQELLFMLNQLELDHKLPSLDYYVDSPLSYEATQVVKKHPENFNDYITGVLKVDSDPFDFKGLQYIQDAEASKALNGRTDPMVIISASGMADAGRVKHHIANNIGDQKNTILIVGYCEPHSLGGHLIGGAKKVHIYGDEYAVVAEVGQMRSMSAHGDYQDLLHFLAGQDPTKVRKVFVVHGEYPVQQGFQKHLAEKGFTNVEIPERHQVFEL
ncbi:MBL fold metallo-hydrolase RNA specificity domain-containing protein [Dinghuibacter silviterrae]|uniref:Metallo-beta-lactamase family protein n=1 Tax=Dinghuibacter silviterrae TaxID=1539049 RepID=A0A4V3GLE7_9BACT|nr:MBL fold metallo-hydrolase [Dinghuibacter silviterrae]TDW99142.1 metallo-beta-lactamase family protein [Dinghuibacter silviterrae]